MKIFLLSLAASQWCHQSNQASVGSWPERLTGRPVLRNRSIDTLSRFTGKRSPYVIISLKDSSDTVL